MNRVIPLCILMSAAGFAGAQSTQAKAPAAKMTCPAGDPWTLAPDGRQHIIQNSKTPVRVKICYCEGGKPHDFIDVVTVDDSYPGKPDPKPDPKGGEKSNAKPGDASGKSGPIGTKGNTSTALALGSCGEYAGQSVYIVNRNKGDVSGIYVVRDGGKDK